MVEYVNLSDINEYTLYRLSINITVNLYIHDTYYFQYCGFY